MPAPDVAPDPPSFPDPTHPAHPSSIWWSRRAVGLHATIIVVVPVFCGLFWWQVQRVRQGNTLSWAYVFEWPFFTGYAVYLWWKLVHDRTDLPARPVPVAGVPSTGARADGSGGEDSDGREDSDVDEELAAYNRYLAELDASGRRKRW